MNILIVDDDATIAEWLSQTVQLNSNHQVHSATSGAEAIALAQNIGRVHLLISDVVMDQIDGFTLRQSLQAQFPELATIFVSGYDLSDFSEHINGTQVLSKPVQPEVLMRVISDAEQALARANESTAKVESQRLRSSSANLRNLVQKQGFTGKLDQFQLVDIIQMCCLSRRSGRLQISKGIESGVIFLRDGNMIHAVTGELEGEHAVYKIISWDFGQFSFEDGLLPDRQTIQVGWEHLVMEGVRRRDEKGDNKPKDEDENLIGQTIGGYKIVRKMGESNMGEVFEAIQTSIDRTVALKMLWRELGNDPALVQEFIADASAKANVSHPSILSVYEAGQWEGKYFYAREYVDGGTLADLQAQGKPVDDSVALQAIRVTAEAMLHLHQNKIPHKPLTANSIYIGSDKRPRLANIAALTVENPSTVSSDIHALSKVISATMQSGVAASPGMRALLSRMLLEGVAGFPSWGALLQEVKSLEPRANPVDAHKLTERSEAAKRAVEKAKQRQKKAIMVSMIGSMVLLTLVVAIVAFKIIYKPAPKEFGNFMIEIPAGPFIYQQGETVDLPTFYIDKYEVTIRDYIKFLEALEKNPTTQYDHPQQPPSLSHHIPTRWDGYKMAATQEKTYMKAPINLDCPVTDISWFDAYAYAKWKGRRLPTEQEWEKAARGTKGFRYPWGNEFRTKDVNTNADYARNPSGKGNVDGYEWWGPVDAFSGDKSPYGVMNMGGNVSEWTSSWDTRKMGKSEKVPIIRGGSYQSTDILVERRIDQFGPDGSNLALGFRTAADAPPPGVNIEKPKQ